jgi:DNA replication protein DnaC
MTLRSEETLEQTLGRIKETVRQAEIDRQKFLEWLTTQSESIQCATHGRGRPIDPVMSWARSQDHGNRVVVYKKCPSCVEEEGMRARRLFWGNCGIPRKLIGATLEGLHYDSDKCRMYLELCKDFANRRSGFLFLMGALGNGKSHIAAALLQMRRDGFFITQSSLLYRHRQSYNDQRAPNVKRRCMETPLLVLDEIGESVGGRDEGPLLYDILNHRYSEQLPTILTANLSDEEFKEAIGARLVDRFTEVVFAICRFDETSKRQLNNQRYLDGC